MREARPNPRRALKWTADYAEGETMPKPAAIALNAFAAAGCFVAGIFGAPLVPVPFVTIVLGFAGLAYFLKRAEKARAA
jgi:hypothetical protein